MAVDYSRYEFIQAERNDKVLTLPLNRQARGNLRAMKLPAPGGGTRLCRALPLAA